jgi:hypothetical protein
MVHGTNHRPGELTQLRVSNTRRDFNPFFHHEELNRPHAWRLIVADGVISNPAVQPKAFDWQATFIRTGLNSRSGTSREKAQEPQRGKAAAEIKPALTQRRRGPGETQGRRTFSFFLLCVPQRISASLR